MLRARQRGGEVPSPGVKMLGEACFFQNLNQILKLIDNKLHFPRQACSAHGSSQEVTSLYFASSQSRVIEGWGHTDTEAAGQVLAGQRENEDLTWVPHGQELLPCSSELDTMVP